MLQNGNNMLENYFLFKTLMNVESSVLLPVFVRRRNVHTCIHRKKIMEYVEASISQSFLAYSLS